jgi:RNAse (barnase) inhibitor barstar
MAVFETDVLWNHPIDFRLHGGPKLFWQPTVLRSTLKWLADARYQIVEFDAGEWPTESAMHSDLADKFNFPDYYGRNLDALNDCLRDVAVYENFAVKGATGLVVVFHHIDQFVQADRRAAENLLDILAATSEFGMQFGHRILCLAQTDDPRLSLGPVSIAAWQWNPEEWFDSKRGL